MPSQRKHEMEDSVSEYLVRSANSLCGLDLKVSDRPDRRVGSHAPIEGGCDAIISGLGIDVAVEVAEVPIAPGVYSEVAKIEELKVFLEPLLVNACPAQQVDVVIESATLEQAFHWRYPARTKRISEELIGAILGMPLASGLSRYRYVSLTLSDGMRVHVNRKSSDFPFASVAICPSVSSGFDASFSEVLRKKSRQFGLYRDSYLRCIALWSRDFMHLDQSTVVSAFANCVVDLSEVDSVWFVHATSVPHVYPLFGGGVDCRNDKAYLHSYLWWPDGVIGERRPFGFIPHRFGNRPAAGHAVG